jgi:cycloartenol synthase
MYVCMQASMHAFRVCCVLVASGWPISDCTSEGLKAALMIRKHSLLDPSKAAYIPEHRLNDAVNVILSYQNEDGGWATYENRRGGAWFEILNPSEVRLASTVLCLIVQREVLVLCVASLDHVCARRPQNRPQLVTVSGVRRHHGGLLVR